MRKNTMVAALPLTAIVSLIALCWIKLSGPSSSQTSRPIALGLQNYTNASAVVGITNRSFDELNYVVMVERKIGAQWPNYVPGTRISVSQLGGLRPGQFTNLTIAVMVYAPPYPWRVSVFCTRAPVKPNSLRAKAGFLASKLGMRKLSHKLWGEDFKQIQVSTPEMEQWEK